MWCRGGGLIKLELYYDSTVEPFRREDFNRRRILELLNKAEKRGVEVAVIDTASWDSSMLYDIYLKACIPSIRSGYGIRTVFGTARESGRYFGRQVPALLVYEDDGVTDVYPHDEKRRTVTIIEFLGELLAGLPGGESRV